MTTQTEGLHAGEFVLSSLDSLSRDAVTIASGETLAAGIVVGRKTKRLAAAPIPTIVGTGTGLMTDLRFGPDVQVGSYVITLLATSATAAFSVVGPDGVALHNGAVGTAYKSSHLSFLVSNGGTMTTADSYTVVVTAGGTPAMVGGTGTGTISAIALGASAKNGSYRIINRAVVANGGDFEILDPDGLSCGRFLMGTGGGGAASFASDQISFTLTDATDFILGNYFEVIVATHTRQVVAWDPTATDGSQNVAGILWDAVDASGGTKAATILSRMAVVKGSMLAFKSGISAAAQAVCKSRLLPALNLIVR